MARSLPESSITIRGVNYQLLEVMLTELAQWAAPSCSRPQLATDNGVQFTGRYLPPLTDCTPRVSLAHATAPCKSRVQSLGFDLGTIGTLGHSIAYPATHGIGVWVTPKLSL